MKSVKNFNQKYLWFWLELSQWDNSDQHARYATEIDSRHHQEHEIRKIYALLCKLSWNQLKF